MKLTQALLIRYGELSTKGENRKAFIDCLFSNIRSALKSFKSLNFNKTRDYIKIFMNDESVDPILDLLKEIPGIQRIDVVEPASLEMEEIKQKALELIQLEKGKSFKIETKRAYKGYSLDSYQVCVELADYILDHTSLTVDVHHPEVTLNVEIREEGSYLSCRSYLGIGGYPLGMNGKVLLLLSGGIDSPIAAYSLLRRGIKIEALHFASPPYTSEAVIDKLKDLLGKLNLYQESIKLNIAPFTKLQEDIYKYVDEPYCITIMRRMMMRIAFGVAKANHCLAIATGESIGQVASQTLDSIQVINEVTNFPILRPLCAMDKLSIIDLAKKIDTYEISIRPYEDCCTIFKPKKPKTKPKLEDCLYYESKWDYQSEVDQIIANISSSYICQEE